MLLPGKEEDDSAIGGGGIEEASVRGRVVAREDDVHLEERFSSSSTDRDLDNSLQ